MSIVKIDTVGKLCPLPLMEAKQYMPKLEIGDTLIIDYDCAQASENLPRWAVESGHSVTEFKQTGDAKWQISIQKGR